MYWIEDEGLAMWKIESAYVKSLTKAPSVHDKIVISGDRSRAMLNIYDVLPTSARHFVDEYPNNPGVGIIINAYEKIVISIIAGASGRSALTRDAIKEDIVNYVRSGKVQYAVLHK